VTVDLHAHSTRSDGLLTPTALVARALAEGVSGLALTDHDTVEGVAEAQAAAGAGLELVPGLEITAELNGREVHLLGLWVLADHPELRAFCARAREERATRIERMVEALRRANVLVSVDDVRAEAGDATLARPHLARALVAKGYAASVQRAFTHYLGDGCVADVPRRRPSLAEACALVRRCGGVASLAHPGVNKVSRQELGDAARAGLDAVEAFHPDHPPTQADAYVRWGAALGLRATGGSDFHGDGPESHGPPGTWVTPAPEADALRALAASRR
jgi:predicted metal-dependent phosphoesterase TrpH